MTRAIDKDVTGGCVCGAVRYRITGPMRQVVACHCRQCQRFTGSHVNASQCYQDHLHLIEDRGLKWFDSSDFARRAFCSECGSHLFYQRNDGDKISIMAGSLDDTEGLTLVGHIFVREKGDYYDLDEKLPRIAGSGVNEQWNLTSE